MTMTAEEARNVVENLYKATRQAQLTADQHEAIRMTYIRLLAWFDKRIEPHEAVGLGEHG